MFNYSTGLGFNTSHKQKEMRCPRLGLWLNKRDNQGREKYQSRIEMFIELDSMLFINTSTLLDVRPVYNRNLIM